MKSKLRLFDMVRMLASVLIALIIVTVIVYMVSDEPLTAMSILLLGPIKEFSRFGNVIEMMIPLTFTGLAVCIMFKANQFNMISEGAFYIAAVVAGYISIFVDLPPFLLPIVCILAGSICGGALGAVPAVLKIKTNSSVIVVSLMLNYIMILLGNFIVSNVMRDPNSGSGSSYAFQKHAKLSVIIPGTRIHAGLILMIAVVVAVTILIYRSKLGYAIRITGANETFAGYSGLSVNRVIMKSQIIGGAIAGIGGAVELLGMYSRFSWQGSPGYGWDAIIIATLAAGNPIFVPFTALFLAYIRIGADMMAMKSDVPAEIVSIVQAVIILLLSATMFLSGLRNKMILKATLEQEKGEVRS